MNENRPRPTSWNPWPVGVVAAFAVFIGVTAALIAFSAGQRTDLVTTDYYAQEIRYQDQIDRLSRTKRLGEATRIAYDWPKQTLTVAVPPEHVGRGATGVVRLYRPSAAHLDRELPLEVDENGVQTLDARPLRAGPWRVRVAWTVDGEEYFNEKQVVVAPFEE